MDDLLGSILNKMTKPPTVGEQQKKAMQSKSSHFISLKFILLIHFILLHIVLVTRTTRRYTQTTRTRKSTT